MTTFTTLTGKSRQVGYAALLGGLVLGVSACGSQGEGEYLGEVPSGDNLATLVIDGNSVTYEEVTCDGSVDEEHTSVGELNEDRSRVVWSQEGRWSKDDPVTLTDGSVLIQTESASPGADGDLFSEEGLEAADEVRAQHEEDCEG